MIIGGPRAWRVRKHGTFGVSYQWINNEPAMLIYRPGLRGSPGIAICLSAAHLYAGSNSGEPTRYLVDKSFEFAEILGCNKGDARRIAELIVDGLPDLVDMPPEPDWSKGEPGAQIGAVQLREDGQVISEMPLRMQ